MDDPQQTANRVEKYTPLVGSRDIDSDSNMVCLYNMSIVYCVPVALCISLYYALYISVKSTREILNIKISMQL